MPISWNDIKEKYNLNWPISWADVKEAIGDEEWPVSWSEVMAAISGSAKLVSSDGYYLLDVNGNYLIPFEDDYDE